MSSLFKNKNLTISISLVLIVILIILSVDIYSRNNTDKTGKQLNLYDTLKNIFGFTPISDTAKDVLDKIEDVVENTAESLMEDVKLPKLVNVSQENDKVLHEKTLPDISSEVKMDKQLPELDLPPAPVIETPPIIEEPVRYQPKPKKEKKKEVFNIDNNSFTYGQAQAVCRAYDAELATYDQVVNAHREGANWCNYGWSANNMALYPIQDDFHTSLSDTKFKNSCGQPGVNGGYFKDENLKFGVNCYGHRPKPDENKISYNSEDDFSIMELDKELAKNKDLEKEYRKQIETGDIEVRPFNGNKWSRYSDRDSKYMLTPKYNFDNLKDDNNQEGDNDSNYSDDVTPNEPLSPSSTSSTLTEPEDELEMMKEMNDLSIKSNTWLNKTSNHSPKPGLKDVI